VGIEQETLQSAEMRDGQVVLKNDLPAGVLDPVFTMLASGDGTVPSLSAIPIELSGALRHSFVTQKHGSLQNTPHLLDELRERLKQLQVKGLGAIRGIGGPPGGKPGLQVSLEDVFLRGEPVTMRARLINLIQAPGKLLARLEPVEPVGPAIEGEFVEASDQWHLEVGELPVRIVSGGSFHAGWRTGRASACQRFIRGGPLTLYPANEQNMRRYFDSKASNYD
jgi:hypothetical protein